MALPSGVTTCLLTFGPYTDAQGTAIYAGMAGEVIPSAVMRHAETGTRIPATPVRFVIDAVGGASVVLPHTDQAGLKPERGLSLTYEVRWTPKRGVIGSPGNKRIALPQAVGATADFDTLENSPDVPGVLVPIAVSMAVVEQLVESATAAGASAAAAEIASGQAKTVAENARDAARDAQTAAESAAARVADTQTAAATAATDASAARTNAENAAGSASDAALDASQAETWAADAATAASNAATAAGASAANATNAANTVSTAATEAAAARAAANAAAGSASTAQTFAQDAKAAADAAALRADLAQGSASSAATSASRATTDAADASQRAATAESAATSAATSAGTAATQAAAAAENSAMARAALRNAAMDANFHLILSDVDGRKVDVGYVKGDKGDQGIQGVKGDTGDLTPVQTVTAWAGTGGLTATSPETRQRTLSGNFVLTMGALPPGTVAFTVTYVVRQPATGGPFTVTWPALSPTFQWAGGAAAPAMPTVANAELIVHLFWTGLAWRGFVGGTFFP